MNRKTFLTALQRAMTVVERNHVVSALESVKLSNGYIYATNLTVGIKVPVPGLVLSRDIMVNAKMLEKALKNASSDPLHISFQDDKIILKYGAKELKLSSQSAEDYPQEFSIDTERGIQEFTIERVLVNWAIRHTDFAHTDMLRLGMCGMMIDFANDYIGFSNAYYLSYQKLKGLSAIKRFTEIPGLKGEFRGLTIPTKAIECLDPNNEVRVVLPNNFAKKYGSEKEIQLDAETILLECSDGCLIYSKAYNEAPTFSNVIPTGKWLTKLNLKVDDIKQGLKEAAPWWHPVTRLIVCTVTDKVTISTQNEDEECEFSCDLDATIQGKEVTIGFNGKYMQQIVAGLKCETFEVKFWEPNEPMNINEQYLLFPMMMK